MKNASRLATRGFTLIELLTVLMVLSVVSTLGVSAYFQLSSYWNATARAVDQQVTIDRIFQSFQSDLDQLLSAKLTGHALHGETRLESERRYKMVQLEDDRVVLPVEYQNPATGAWTRASVMYHIDRSAPVPVLRRTLGELGAETPAGASEIVAEGVLSLRIRYHTAEGVHDAWSQARHPDSVAVSLVLQNPTRPEEQIARRALLPVQVR